MLTNFLGGSHRRSINLANPLGSKGVLANAFADLIRHLWGDQYTHISPVSLRVNFDYDELD
jgi:ubiquitin carboxyl-terminal hydrolase 8